MDRIARESSVKVNFFQARQIENTKIPVDKSRIKAVVI